MRAASAVGVIVEEPASGSQCKFKRDGLTYPIAAHSGPKTEVSDVYVRGLCRVFALSAEGFAAKLGG